MNHLKIDKNSLTSRNAQLLKTLSPYWQENSWYDPGSNEFSKEGVFQILNELSQLSFDDVDALDILISSLAVIDNTQGDSNRIVSISNESFFGDRNFRYEVTSSFSGSNLINFLKTYMEDGNSDAKSSLEKLYLAKKLAGPLEQLNIQIQFSPALEQRKVNKAIRAFPILDQSGQGEAATYSLSYKLLLDCGETHSVLNTEFAADRGYLLIGNRYVLFQEDMYPAIARQRKLSGLDSTEASAILSNPTQALFPSGTDTEKFDMSEYDKRVASFEYAPRVKFREIVSSNVSWYDADGTKVPYIHLRNQDGQPVNVEISTETVSSLITQMETSLNSGIILADGNPRPVADSAGNLIATSESNLNFLRSFKDILKNAERSTDNKEPGGRRSTRVAVLQEVVLQAQPQTNTGVHLTKEDLSLFLKDGITLKSHQVEGVNWLLNSFFKGNGGVFLCDDMGLGKTLQLILFFTVLQNIEKCPKLASFADRVSKDKPSLVVAPLILISNWDAEVHKFVKPEFGFSVYKLHGANLNSLKTSDGSLYRDWWRNYKLILTNYGTFARYQIDLLRYPFLVSFFDESQNIKNPDIAASKAARGLNSDFVICATGTPIEIRLMDLWSQMDSLKRRPTHPLGKEEHFVRDFEKSEQGYEKVKAVVKLNENDGLMIRRDKSILRSAGELKDKVIHDPFYIQMSAFQETQESFITQTFEGNTLKILQHLQMLYQHPYLLGKTAVQAGVQAAISDSPKLQKTLEIVNSIRMKDEKVLVFTLWTEMQSLLQRVFMETYGLDVDVINGDVNARARTSGRSPALEIIDKFSKKEGFNILILSPLAAGAGLNIIAANHVIHYGRWWNPAKEDQSTDRAYRIGQEKTVHVYYPVLVNSQGAGFDKILDQRVRDRRQMAFDVLQPINSSDVDDIFGK